MLATDTALRAHCAPSPLSSTRDVSLVARILCGLALMIAPAAPLACGATDGGGEGSACGGFPNKTCASGFVCDAARSHDAAGTCHLMKVIEVGGPCYRGVSEETSADAPHGNVCMESLLCVGGICTARGSVAAPGRCDFISSLCAAGLYCDPGDGRSGGMCTPLVANGRACASDEACAAGRCGDGKGNNVCM